MLNKATSVESKVKTYSNNDYSNNNENNFFTEASFGTRENQNLNQYSNRKINNSNSKVAKELENIS